MINDALTMADLSPPRGGFDSTHLLRTHSAISAKKIITITIYLDIVLQESQPTWHVFSQQNQWLCVLNYSQTPPNMQLSPLPKETK